MNFLKLDRIQQDFHLLQQALFIFNLSIQLEIERIVVFDDIESIHNEILFHAAIDNYGYITAFLLCILCITFDLFFIDIFEQTSNLLR
jgi:hypothetical protein